MSNIFTVMTQSAAGVIDRRSPLGAAHTVSAAGKSNKKAKRKAKKKAKKLCRNQVAQCQTALTALCDDDPVCLEGLACCDLFATCDTTGALVCIFPDA